ncbi:hypothetical protein [Frankia sp. QA3]|uniref:hypothetical protein n=1 Tax=Frankia sp. QA3 TaxID=710111 RepID=UPI000269BCF6|nr:hypothetical protein [Frankia sp. QA3]EIV92939.1 hypothetical protein FraQA3DRAFT_2610 [Frankia sp. QA3]
MGLALFLALVVGETWGDAITHGIVSLLYYPAGRLGASMHRKAAEGSAAARARRTQRTSGSGHLSSDDR